MPLITTLVTAVVCDLCSANDVHGSSDAAPLAREYFAGLGWMLVDSEVHIYGHPRPAGVLCPKCVPLLVVELGARPSSG